MAVHRHQVYMAANGSAVHIRLLNPISESEKLLPRGHRKTLGTVPELLGYAATSTFRNKKFSSCNVAEANCKLLKHATIRQH